MFWKSIRIFCGVETGNGNSIIGLICFGFLMPFSVTEIKNSCWSKHTRRFRTRARKVLFGLSCQTSWKFMQASRKWAFPPGSCEPDAKSCLLFISWYSAWSCLAWFPSAPFWNESKLYLGLVSQAATIPQFQQSTSEHCWIWIFKNSVPLPGFSSSLQRFNCHTASGALSRYWVPQVTKCFILELKWGWLLSSVWNP